MSPPAIWIHNWIPNYNKLLSCWNDYVEKMFSESEDDSVEHSVGDDGAVMRHSFSFTLSVCVGSYLYTKIMYY